MLRAQYAEAASGGQKVRVLIVPGHEPGYGGAEFDGLYEREITVAISNRLAQELRADSNLEVLVARGNEGWNSDLAAFFKNMRSIQTYVDKAKKVFVKLVKRGKIEEKTEEVAHNTAPTNVALRLYGINKWANEHHVDLMIHVHLNDEAGHKENIPGTQSGVALYVPDAQYGNARASKAVAQNVFKRLSILNATSTMPLEDAGIVEDQELIALGAFNTSKVPSILVEYGYIYESKFKHPEVLPSVLHDMAYATALGVSDFFGTTVVTKYDTRALPYSFLTDSTAMSTTSTLRAGPDIYALQAALLSEGLYPAEGKSLTECPVSGVFGPCTVDAVKAFQTKNGIEQSGSLGPSTRTALNALFSRTPVLALVPSMQQESQACVFTKALSRNATGDDVTVLQTILAQDPTIYPEGTITGYFGPATETAVGRFQEKNKITTKGHAGYGIVGPLTSAVLCK
jgi:peptidoglycan hydrolase-like protein with peptidoglycan-binding domain/N-acetylmuramoyl-L-alanine amidase